MDYGSVNNMTGMYGGAKHSGIYKKPSNGGINYHFKSRAPLGSDHRTWSPNSKKNASTGTPNNLIDQSHRD